MANEFGQEVFLTVHDEAGTIIVFDATGLRVDFDVRHIDGFSRGTFTLYNLADSTVTALASGGNYVTVKTMLHGSQEYTVANSFFVSNVLEEKKLPNSVTTLFCFDKLRKQNLEKTVDVIVKRPTLKRQVAAILDAAEFSGGIEYKTFPLGRIDQESSRPQSSHQGTAQQCLRVLQKTHQFKLFTDPNAGFTLMYLPNLGEVDTTGLSSKEADVILHTDNMRANPKIGPATLLVTSNLDGRIKPAAVLDISNLITVGVQGLNNEQLEIAELLKTTVAGYDKYQTLTVQHKGSNFTSEWKTVATATSPTRGKSMPTINWQKGT